MWEGIGARSFIPDCLKPAGYPRIGDTPNSRL